MVNAEVLDLDTATYLNERLYTDIICFEVIARTAKTITIRRMSQGEPVSRTEGNYPIIRYAAVPDEGLTGLRLRLRNDGTYRRYPGGNPLYPVEVPYFQTDYSY